MASLLAQLPGPINLRLVLSDLKFADILHDLVTAKGNRSGVPRVLAVDRNETRELAGTLHIEGMGKDNAIAQIRAVNKLVTVGTTLTLKSTDATSSVTLNILPSRGVSQPLDELFELPGTASGVLASCPFSFTCEPYAYGPEMAVYSNTGAVLPNVIDIDVPGDYPTPLKVSFDQIASGAVHAMYIGMLPDQATPLSSLLRPASSAHYGECWVDQGNPPMVYTVLPHGLTSGQTVEFFDSATTPAGLNGSPYVCTVVDALRFTIPGSVAGGGTAVLTYFTSPTGRVGVIEDVNCLSGWNRNYASLGAYASWEVDDRSMPPGTYLPLVRTKQAGAGANNVVLSGTATAAGGSGFQGSDATYALNPLSKMLHLPYYRMPDPAATWKTPKLWWIPSGGTPTLYMDYLALMPTTWGWAFYHNPYPAGGTANFVLGYNGIVYKDLVATPDGRSGGMLAVGASRLFMVAAERQDAAHASAVTGRLIIWAVPRYALWR